MPGEHVAHHPHCQKKKSKQKEKTAQEPSPFVRGEAPTIQIVTTQKQTQQHCRHQIQNRQSAKET